MSSTCQIFSGLKPLTLSIDIFQVSIGMAVLCIPWLRWKHPEWERPIRVSLVWPVLYILATVFITIVPMVARPFETGMGCVMILTALPVYLICIHWKQRPALVIKLQGKNCFVRKIFKSSFDQTIQLSSSKKSCWFWRLPKKKREDCIKLHAAQNIRH